MSERPDPPPPNFNVGGYAGTGKYRLRAGLFGFAILEEKQFRYDGSIVWRRCMPGWTVRIDGEAP